MMNKVLLLVLILLLILVEISKGRRSSNKIHSGEILSSRNRAGAQFTETIDDYTVFKLKLSSQCGFHKLLKRSTDPSSYTLSKPSFNTDSSAQRMMNLAYKLVTSTVNWQQKRKHNDVTFQRRRRRNILIDEFGVSKQELSNLVGRMEFLNDAHISLVSRLISCPFESNIELNKNPEVKFLQANQFQQNK